MTLDAFDVVDPAGGATWTTDDSEVSADAPVTNASVVWSADGTGLLVFDDGDRTVGQYRLRLAPGSDGQFDAPVAIDVPWDRS